MQLVYYLQSGLPGNSMVCQMGTGTQYTTHMELGILWVVRSGWTRFEQNAIIGSMASWDMLAHNLNGFFVQRNLMFCSHLNRSCFQHLKSIFCANFVWQSIEKLTIRMFDLHTHVLSSIVM